MSLGEALDLEPSGEIVSIVGGGGKSALLFRLAQELPGRAVLTTTTRIFAAQIERAPEVCSVDGDGLEAALDRGTSGLLVIGDVEGEKALGVESTVPGQLLRHPCVDVVAVEADGSRMRPTKAPAEHEPVVPSDTTLLVPVAGIDALQGPLSAVAHRPERVAELIGVGLDEPLTAQTLGALLRHPEGGLKNAPASARISVLLNKVESQAELRLAREVAEEVLRERRISRVAVGALEGLAPKIWHVYEAAAARA
jgi:molybdenum cofactor cytidylyltransferase